MVTHICKRKEHSSGMGYVYCMMTKCMYVCDVCKKCKDGRCKHEDRRRRGYPQQRTKKRTGAMRCPDAHSNENSASEHAHVFPFAAVLLNSFAFSIAA